MRIVKKRISSLFIKFIKYIYSKYNTRVFNVLRSPKSENDFALQITHSLSVNKKNGSYYTLITILVLTSNQEI